MGMHIAESAQGTSAPMLRVATAAQAAETVGLCVAVVFNVIDSASGNSSTASNAAGFIAFEVIIAIGWALIAAGIARARPWSRTPAILSQVFTAMIAIWLLEAHRYAWGVPALLLAILGCVGLFAPTTFRALAHPADPPGPAPQ
jgi:hypothetical protein